MISEIEIGPYYLEIFDRLPEPLDKVEASKRLPISRTMREADLISLLIAHGKDSIWFRVHWILNADRETFLLLQLYDRTAEDPMSLPCCVVKREKENEIELLGDEEARTVIEAMRDEISDSFEKLGQGEAFKASRQRIHQIFNTATIES